MGTPEALMTCPEQARKVVTLLILGDNTSPHILCRVLRPPALVVTIHAV